ncbi:MAG: hypothetical protein A3K10_09630 [Bacteroidetes bacterium RIFCSPLOWO2_12_FULL_31_6]|nr:MAG: hypothetical protein A3K10_09630 [Bacteroidetes bacterium RIFCSPLOWO2_12_FULL_31_6]
MKNNSYLKLFSFSILLFIVHFIVSKYILPAYFIGGIYKMHLFLGLITLITIFLIQRITKVDVTNFGKGYMVSVVLKMLLVIGFLWTVIFNPTPNQKIYIIHFFILFFIYLITEVKLLISLIKK